MKNKEKILHSSLRLFNQNGFVNVRLQHISDDTIISVGNIAYHFKNKEAIVQALFLEWEKRIKEVLIEYRHTPIFESMDRIFLSMESLQEEFRFFFSDILEIKRSYPDFFEQIQQVYQYQVMAFQEIIRFNIARGAMQKLEEPQLHLLSRVCKVRIEQSPNE
ncbi:MAG: TetR/AcrR family transcriptional regulator [Bacteroidota bacterium]